LSKEGKEILTLSSALAEPITAITIQKSSIWFNHECIVTTFLDGHNKECYMSRDRINVFSVARISNDTEFDIVMGCKDNLLRIARGQKLMLEVPTPSAVTSLAVCNQNHDPEIFKSHIFIGTDIGTLCLLSIHVGSKSYSIITVSEDQQKSPITVLKLYPILGDDKKLQIIIGREDGRIEIKNVENILNRYQSNLKLNDLDFNTDTLFYADLGIIML
jgi:hypothetical protein